MNITIPSDDRVMLTIVNLCEFVEGLHDQLCCLRVHDQRFTDIQEGIERVLDIQQTLGDSFGAWVAWGKKYIYFPSRVDELEWINYIPRDWDNECAQEHYEPEIYGSDQE